MSSLKTLYRHSSHYLGGRVAVMLLGFVSFPLFTRVFSVADYGTINLITNAVLLLTVVSKFGFQHAVQRYYPESAGAADPNALRRYYSTLFYGTAIFAAVLSVLFGISIFFGTARFLGISAVGTLLLACALVMIRSLRSMQMNLMQMENKTRLFNGMDILQKALSIAAICALLFFWQKTVFAFFLGLVAVEGAVLLQYLPVLGRRKLVSPAMFDTVFLMAALRFSFPLMLAEISWVVLDSGDRFFIQHYLGAQPLGFYAAAYGIAIYLQDVMMQPLQLALFPICMKVWNSEGKKATQEFLSRSLDHFLLAAVAVVCVAIVTSHDVIVLLASKKFSQAYTLLPFLVIGLVLSAVTIYFRPGLLIHQRASKIAAATFYASVLNVAMNIVLLPRIGLVGAAVATMVSYAGIVMFLGYQSLRVLPFKMEPVALLRYVAVGAGVSWLAAKLPIETPWIAVVTKATLIFVLYAAILCMMDAHVRTLLSKIWSATANSLRRPKEQASQSAMEPSLPAMSERT
ncbi:MAG TPA: oligosaccharide flippase family protein [Candidatus Angelobacter sp.]|nr:oligosaccharide flippase family protein [Candidatus Angelobacter sp.]